MNNLKGDYINNLCYAILLTLYSRGALYAYVIRKYIEEGTKGTINPSLATLYGSFSRLLKDGLIEREKDETVDGRVRRSYRITKSGCGAINNKKKVLQCLLDLDRANTPLRTSSDLYPSTPPE